MLMKYVYIIKSLRESEEKLLFFYRGEFLE
jgi:hypothetical protein